jgi:hypothetical protein
LDVAVDLIDRDGVVHEVHRPLAELNTPGKRLGWLRKIAGLDEGSSQDVALLEHASRLTPINDGDRVVGMAALSTAVFQGARSPATISTVGGLASMISQSDFSRFVGAIDYEPSSAKRDPSSFPTGRQQSIDNWANEQKKLLPDQRSNALAWCHATCSLSDLKCDPIEVATFIIRREDQFIVLSLDEMVNLANFNGVAFYKSHIMDHIDVNHNLGAFSGMSTFWPVRNSNLLSLERDGNGQFINTSAMSCILRRAKERGIMLDLTRSPETPQAFFGPIEVLILKGRVPMDSITIEFAS